jgi:hypothetical protein
MHFTSGLAGLLVVLSVTSCDSVAVGDGNGVELIELPGVDRVSRGGSFETVVRTREEYDRLIQERYHDPLNEYCNRSYPEERLELEHQEPPLTEGEIQEILNRQCIARDLLYRGLLSVRHPEIDFSKHSLLGLGVGAGGCTQPEYLIHFSRSGMTYTLYVRITEFGRCERAWSKNLWVLTPRIPEYAGVRFEKVVKRDYPFRDILDNQRELSSREG